MPDNTKKKFEGFTEDERAAMKARAKELAAEARSDKNKAQGENDVMEAIAAMSESDHTMAKRIHEIIKETAPALLPKTWYGMPSYANKDGKVVCFFQAAGKFNYRYATLGFQEQAKLDEGNMWPASYALLKITAAEESRIKELLKRALS